MNIENYLPEILEITAFVMLVVMVGINFYYFKIYKKKIKKSLTFNRSSLFAKNKARTSFTHKNPLFPAIHKSVSIVFGFSILVILGYLFFIPPKIQSISIENGQAWQDYTKPLEIVFDRPLKKDLSAFKLSSEIKGEWRFEKANKFDLFKRKVVFVPEETLLPNEKITLNAVVDSLLPVAKGKFQTEFLSGTSNPPINISEEIQDRQNVNPEEEILVEMPNVDPYSYIMDLESTPNIELTKATTEDQKIKISHALPFTNGQAYEIKIFITPVTYNLNTKEILKRGEKFESSSIKFQIAPTPSIKDISPKGSSVLSSEQIKIEFGNEMDKAIVEASYKIEPAIDGDLEWNEEATILSIKPKSPLAKETDYRISFSQDIKSKYGAKFFQNFAGEPRPQLEFTFKTIGSVGISGISPSANSTGVSIDTNVSISFNQAVDQASAQSKFAISPAVAGTFSWNGNTMVFNPNASLDYSKQYSVTMSAGIKSIDGLDLKSSYSFKFTTKSNKVLLNVPIMRQPEQFACNVTAAAIVLKYRGVNVSPMQVYNSIPHETAPKTATTWGNPYKGFVGNIYGAYGGDHSAGYGVYWGPIANYISNYRPVEIKTGWNVADLLREVDKGNPSILWWQNGAANPTKMTWTAPDGTVVNGVNGMHSEVVVGYIGSPENPSQIILSDPWSDRWGNGYHYITLDRFNYLWGFFGRTAVVVR
jgi:uncharacterized protein YvpB